MISCATVRENISVIFFQIDLVHILFIFPFAETPVLTARAGICADAFCMLVVFWHDWCIVSVHQEKCHQYWPAERSARYQYFVVDPMAEYNMPQYILREFKVTDARVRHQTLGPSSSLWFVYYSAYADWVELTGL